MLRIKVTVELPNIYLNDNSDELKVDRDFRFYQRVFAELPDQGIIDYFYHNSTIYFTRDILDRGEDLFTKIFLDFKNELQKKGFDTYFTYIDNNAIKEVDDPWLDTRTTITIIKNEAAFSLRINILSEFTGAWFDVHHFTFDVLVKDYFLNTYGIKLDNHKCYQRFANLDGRSSGSKEFKLILFQLRSSMQQAFDRLNEIRTLYKILKLKRDAAVIEFSETIVGDFESEDAYKQTQRLGAIVSSALHQVNPRLVKISKVHPLPPGTIINLKLAFDQLVWGLQNMDDIRTIENDVI